jgi:hypothetical protein
MNIVMEFEFRRHLEERGFSAEPIDFSIAAVEEFEEYLGKIGTTFDIASLDALKDYVSSLMGAGKSSLERLIAIARYCSLARKNDYLVYLVSLFGARNVLPDIGERLAIIADDETRNRVFERFELPPLGSSQEAYPRLTKMIMDRMETELPAETCRKVLTWNYHKVPIEAFKEKKERFEKANNIDDYLRDEHKRFVEELEGYMKEGRIWYEQEITPEVLEFVKSDQEICTGVRHGDQIYVTKIPFAPKQYLMEKNPTMKRYYACHCQLARTAIRDGEPRISRNFCYCSAGYEKLRFDAIFGEPVEVEVLESVLDGDERCRFANKIPKGKMK